MHILEGLLLALLLALGIRTAATDIRKGYIYNRDLLFVLLPGGVLAGIYYAVFVPDIFGDYLLNAGLVFVIQLLLYKMNACAGGDFKLGMVIALLYPARLYVSYRGIVITLFFYIGYALFYGYAYLVINAVIRMIRKKSSLNRRYAADYLKKFALSYVRAMLYILAINMAASEIGEYVYLPSWIVWIFCMVVAWLSRRRKVLQKKALVAAIAAADVIGIIVFRVIPFSVYPETYLFSAVLLVCQILVSSVLYDTIATEDVKQGMILSRASSLMMQGSRVKGLPGISSENLRDRLTAEQAESIHRWAKSKRGQKQVTIMRKIPFAVFLLLGIGTYWMIWVMINEI